MGLVVLDEVHYLGDPSRGSVWEEVIINCPPHIQLCAMSATVANADDLGAWIDEVTILPAGTSCCNKCDVHCAGLECVWAQPNCGEA